MIDATIHGVVAKPLVRSWNMLNSFRQDPLAHGFVRIAELRLFNRKSALSSSTIRQQLVAFGPDPP